MNIRQLSLNVVGVILILVALCLSALLLLPYFVKIDKHRPQKLKCELNLKKIELGFRQWAIEMFGSTVSPSLNPLRGGSLRQNWSRRTDQMLSYRLF